MRGRRRAARAALAALLAVSLWASAGRADPAPDLGRLRSLYLAAVEDTRALDEGLQEVARLRAAAAPREGSGLGGSLTAYEGALISLRAKHALWPPTRLRHLREGLALLDAVVAAQPGHAEARYLRAMTCFHLPSFLGREGTVREDFRALARLLPHEGARYPWPLYSGIVRFLLENAELSAEERRPLERALLAGDE